MRPYGSNLYLTLTAPMLAAISILATPAYAQEVITEDFKLVADDGIQGGHYGFSLALDDGTIALGAQYDDENGIDSGAVFLYDASTGLQTTKLLHNDGQPGDYFGSSIAIDNQLIVIGAPGNFPSSPNYRGAAYLFDASTGSLISQLIPDDDFKEPIFGWLGESVAIGPNVVAVGLNEINGTGTVYLFDPITGTQLAKLIPNDQTNNMSFGVALAVHNGVIAVGASYASVNDTRPGAVYLFDGDPQSPSFGQQTNKLYPSDGITGAGFGSSVALNDTTIAIGSPGDYTNGFNSGAAYLFDIASGEQLAKLLPHDGAPQFNFGRSVALTDRTLAVSSRFRTDFASDLDGTGYLFDLATQTEIANLLPSELDTFSGFGDSIVIQDDTIAVASNRAVENAQRSVATYVFNYTNTYCQADLTEDGVLNTLDVTAFFIYFSSQNPMTDFTNDDRWNFYDISAFFHAFTNGCP